MEGADERAVSNFRLMSADIRLKLLQTCEISEDLLIFLLFYFFVGKEK